MFLIVLSLSLSEVNKNFFYWRCCIFNSNSRVIGMEEVVINKVKLLFFYNLKFNECCCIFIIFSLDVMENLI